MNTTPAGVGSAGCCVCTGVWPGSCGAVTMGVELEAAAAAAVGVAAALTPCAAASTATAAANGDLAAAASVAEVAAPAAVVDELGAALSTTSCDLCACVFRPKPACECSDSVDSVWRRRLATDSGS